MILTNEQRADMGLDAVLSVMEQFEAVGLWPAVSSIEDALTCIAHLCDRVGLAPAETFNEALRRYRMNLEGDNRAAQVVDGLRTTLKEIQDDADTDGSGARVPAHAG